MSESQVWIHSGEECDGVPILYSFSRVERSEDCPDCKSGVRGRRVERCGAWEATVAIHAWQRTAN